MASRLKSAIFQEFVAFTRELFDSREFIPLHAPNLSPLETRKVQEALDSTFVSSAGKYVDRIEEQICQLTGSGFSVATGTGTAALQVALRLAGVERDTEVVTQPLSFVATANAIRYLHADPVFVDVDRETLGLSPTALQDFLERNTTVTDQGCFNQVTGRRIAACVPMHTFGFPARIAELREICQARHIPLVEDAAESLGSTIGDRHTGTFGMAGAISFNGNKIATAGGGGVILFNDEALARRAKHLTTTAKRAHAWEYYHDEVGYNYRMPNLNAALLSAQLDRLPLFLEAKRKLAHAYREFCEQHELRLCWERSGTAANFWLLSLLLPDRQARDEFLEATNAEGVMTRPAWNLLNELPMYAECLTASIPNARYLADRLVNIPSSAITTENHE